MLSDMGGRSQPYLSTVSEKMVLVNLNCIVGLDLIVHSRLKINDIWSLPVFPGILQSPSFTSIKFYDLLPLL